MLLGGDSLSKGSAVRLSKRQCNRSVMVRALRWGLSTCLLVIVRIACEFQSNVTV